MHTDIQTASVNRLAIIQDKGRELLLVGIKEGYTDKPQYQKQLQTEWKRHHELDHPNIIKYTEQREDADFGPAIAMEWEPARSLAEYMQESHSDEEKKAIVRQVAAALGYMHQQGLVHSAVSPATIFITRQGDRAKLLCFRLRYADRLNEPQQDVKYHAPEAKDGTVNLDARCDIFSLGILTRELGLTDGYQDLIKTATLTGRAQRYADTEAFCDALDHRRTARRSKSATASSASAASGANKRIAVLISTVVILVIAAILVLWNQQASEDDALVAQTENTQGAEPTESSEASESTESPEGSSAPSGSSDSSAPSGSSGSSAPSSSSSSDYHYSGDLIFLNDLLPQMRIDLDKIYAKAKDKADARRRVQTYYKGLRRAISPKSDAQMAAFDKEFAQYVNQKNQ